MSSCYLWSNHSSIYSEFLSAPTAPTGPPDWKLIEAKSPLDWQSEIVKTGWPSKGGTRGRWHPINQTHSKCHSLSMEVYQCSFNDQNLNFEWVLQVSAKKCSSHGWILKVCVGIMNLPWAQYSGTKALCGSVFNWGGAGGLCVWALTSNLATNWS